MPDTLIESVVSMPVVNPDTGRCSRSFHFWGVTDYVEGNRLVDWKGVADPYRFITQQQIGYQGELYVLALARLGIDIHEIEYRLITRPTIRFCEGKDHWNRQVYEGRCDEWMLERAERLVTHNYPINPAKLVQAKWFLWECSKRILENRRCDRWIPNVKGCFAYERECQYVELCKLVQAGADWEGAIEDGYEVRESSHPELRGMHGANERVLTSTSTLDLTLCEMLYLWRHEKRLKRRSTGDVEVLWIGSAMHRGLEAYVAEGGGEELAFAAIDGWAAENPVLGEAAGRKQDQDVAKARAMVRAAALKWIS